MIRMDVPHDSERCSRDFNQIHAVLFSYRHLFPSQYYIIIVHVFVNVYDQSELIVLSNGTEN